VNQSQFHNDDNICEAIGCFVEATSKVNVKVGMEGTITLHLCVNCIHKFDQKEKVLESVLQPVSNTNQFIPPLSTRGNASRK
jgi:hypothetical protein